MEPTFPRSLSNSIIFFKEKLEGFQVARSWSCLAIKQAVQEVDLARTHQPLEVSLDGIEGFGGSCVFFQDRRKFIVKCDLHKEKERL